MKRIVIIVILLSISLLFIGCDFFDFDNKPTKGLEFTLNEEGTAYSVSKGEMKETVTNLVIPSIYQELPVNIINDYAFSNLKNIENVVIPDGIETIGIEAFRGCVNLKAVTIPDSVVKIGKSTFFGCTSIETMTIPFIGETRSGYNAFFGYIFGAITPHDNAAFIPSSLKTVIITEGLASIPSYAFYNCSMITTLTLPSSIESIDVLSLFGCVNIEILTIPHAIPFSHMFGDNSLPESLHTIHINSNIKSIFPSAFDGLIGLKNIILPDTLEHIGSRAFANCTSLTEIIIPKSVIMIDANAFIGSSELTIYCEIYSQSTIWSAQWNSEDRPVIYGYVKNN